MARPKNLDPNMTTPISVRLFKEQKKRLQETARKVRLSDQDCLRKALDFGLPALERALEQPANA